MKLSRGSTNWQKYMPPTQAKQTLAAARLLLLITSTTCG
jgi:hypothetical protein